MLSLLLMQLRAQTILHLLLPLSKSPRQTHLNIFQKIIKIFINQNPHLSIHTPLLLLPHIFNLMRNPFQISMNLRHLLFNLSQMFFNNTLPLTARPNLPLNLRLQLLNLNLKRRNLRNIFQPRTNISFLLSKPPSIQPI